MSQWFIRTSFALALAFSLVPSDASADPPACARWNSKVSCTQAGSCGTSSAQKASYYNWLYSDTAQEACKKQYQKQYPSYLINGGPNGTPGKLEAKPTDNDPVNSYACWIDQSPLDGVVDTYSSVVDREPLTPEPCCFRTPRGPYRNSTTGASTGTYGAAFGSRRDRVINFNWTKNGHKVISDYKWDYILNLTETPFHPSSAEVDHIIPRVDIRGCGCGQNSYANALVISRGLNNDMKNYCDNPDRVEILDEFTLP